MEEKKIKCVKDTNVSTNGNSPEQDERNDRSTDD